MPQVWYQSRLLPVLHVVPLTALPAHLPDPPVGTMQQQQQRLQQEQQDNSSEQKLAG